MVGVKGKGTGIFLFLALLIVVAGSFLIATSEDSTSLKTAFGEVSFFGGNSLTGAAIGIEEVGSGEIRVQSTCAASYASGGTINSTVVCENEVFTVEGILTINDLSETAVTQFGASSGSAYNLISNSTSINLEIPDLVKTTPSQYTNDWDSSSDAEFYIVMNESMNVVQAYSNSSASNKLYGFNLDNSDTSGGNIGAVIGYELTWGYYDLAGGWLLAYYNTSEGNFLFIDLGSSPSGSKAIDTTVDPNLLRNYTFYWNYSGSQYEIVINTSGAWNDKKTITSDTVTPFYTTFKNSAPSSVGKGNLILNNITLTLSSNFTVNGILNASNSFLYFGSNNSLFRSNSGSSVVINNSNVTSNNSGFHYSIRSLGSDFTLENSYLDYLGVVVGGSTYCFSLEGTGGTVRNVTLGPNQAMYGIQIRGSGISLLNTSFGTGASNTLSLNGNCYGNTIRGNNLSKGISYLDMGSPYNNLIVENYFQGGLIGISSPSATPYNNTYLNNYISTSITDTANNYSNYFVYNNSYGQIKWYRNNFSASGTTPTLILDQTVFVQSNLLGVEIGSLLNNFNTTAELTFRGLLWNISAQLCENVSGALSNCLNCNASNNCSYSNTTGILVANVTHFSNYSTNGSIVVGQETPAVTYLSNFTDSFTGVSINLSRYYPEVSGTLEVTQNDVLIINGTDTGTESYAGIITNSSVNTSRSFYLAVNVNLTNTSAVTSTVGFTDVWLSFTDSVASADLAICRIFINQTVVFLRDGSGHAVPISTTNGTLVLSFNVSSLNYTCQFAGKNLTDYNLSGLGNNFNMLLESDALNTSVWAEMDNLEFAYGVYSAPVTETPAGPGLTIYNNGFFENFTSLNSTYYGNLSSGFASPSVVNSQLMMNKTTLAGTGYDYFYTVVDNISITNSWNVSVWVNLTNTTADAQGNYLIEAGILIYNRTDGGSLACEVAYGDGLGLVLGNYNETLDSSPAYTSASRSYGNLTYSYNVNTGIFNCSLDDGTSVSGNSSSFHGGMGIGLVSRLSQIGGVTPNASVTAYFDNFNYTYVVAEAPAAVTYLSNFTDSFTGASINTSFYYVIPSGMTTSQNNQIVVNGSGDNGGGIATLNTVNLSRSFELYVNITKINSSTITGNNIIETGLFVTIINGSDFIRCKVQQNASGHYLNAASLSGGSFDNITSINSPDGSLHMIYNVSSNVFTCALNGQSVSNVNESAPASNYSILLMGSVDGGNMSAVSAWNTTFDNLSFSYGIASAVAEAPAVTYLSNFTDSFTGVSINTSRYNVTVNGVTVSQNDKIVMNGSSGFSFVATNSYVNVSNNFSVSVKVSKFDNSTYSILAGDPYSTFGLFISNFSGSSWTNLVRCKIAMNSSGYFLNVANPGITVPVSYVENATLTLNYHANNYTCDCSYGGQTLSCNNETTPSANYSVMLFGGPISVSNLQFDDLNLTYNPIAVAEAPAADNYPNVTLANPENNYINDSASRINITFECDANDDYQLVNISLYLTNSTNASFALNQTTNVGGTSNSTSWVVELGNGNYTWGCQAFDNASQSNFSAVNHSILINYSAPVIDTTYPTLSLISPTSGNYTNLGNSSLPFVFSVRDAYDPSLNCILYLNGVVRGNNATTQNDTNTALYSSVAFSEGSNSWYVNCSDAAGNSNVSSTWNFTYDSINPAVSGPAVNVSRTKSSSGVRVNVTVIDTNFNNITANGLLMSQLSGNVYTLATTGSALGCNEGTCTITFNASDLVGNRNDTLTTTYILDDTAPTLNVNSTNPASGATYSASATYLFNITWTEGGTVSSSLLEFNGVNYSMNSAGSNSFYYNISSLSAGTYNYRFIATDDSNNLGNTSSYAYVVAQATPTITALLNGSANNLTIAYPNTVNASGSTNVGTLVVYRNGTAVTNGGASLLAVGYYQYDFNVTGNQNYSNASTTLYANVTKGTPVLTYYLNGATANSTVVYPGTVNASGSTTGGTLAIYKNGTLVTNGEANILAVAYYQYDFNVTGGQNYSDISRTLYANVTQATPGLSLYLNGAEGNLTVAYGTKVTVTANNSASQPTYGLYRDGVTISSGDVVSNLSYGTTYTYVYNTSGNENYSAANVSYVLNVTLTSSQAYTNGSSIIVDNTTTEIVIGNSSLSTVTLNSSISSTQRVNLSFGLLLNNSLGMFSLGENNLTLTREGDITNYTLEIPANTNLTGGSAWDGKFALPFVETTAAYTAPSGSANLVISAGSSVEINLSAPAKILLPGMAGKSASWSRGGTLTQITLACDNATNPTNIDATTNRMCYKDSGLDLVLWTYHFTNFAAYTPSSGSSSSSSSGGGSGGSGVTTYIPPVEESVVENPAPVIKKPVKVETPPVTTGPGVVAEEEVPAAVPEKKAMVGMALWTDLKNISKDFSVAWIAFVLIVIIVIVGRFAEVAIKKRRSATKVETPKKKEETSGKSKQKELDDFIRKSLKRGFNAGEITQALKEKGWSAIGTRKYVEKIIKESKKK